MTAVLVGERIFFILLFFAAIATVLKHWPFCGHIKRAGSGACQSSIKIQSSHKRQCTSERLFVWVIFFFFKANIKKRQFKGQAGERMAEPLLLRICTGAQNGKASGFCGGGFKLCLSTQLRFKVDTFGCNVG